ncbi:paraneoplastic antigen Ma3-like [Menidia menidia]
MESVKVPNSLIISGLSETEVDNEVFEHLKQYGKISRIVKMPDACDQVIVEYESGLAVETLKGSLPFDRVCDGNTDIVHHVDALANVYSPEKGTGLTESFLTQLRDIAKYSGKSFEMLLQNELARISYLVGQTKPASENVIEPVLINLDDELAKQTPSNTDPEIEESPKTAESHSIYSEHTPEPTKSISPDISRPDPLPQLRPALDHLNPPEMQRFIVEHVVKSSDLRSDLHSVKLRTFSGRVPCPSTEVDYDTWRSSVEFYLADPAVSKGQLVRKIVDSLVAPAATVVKSLGPYVPPRAYLNLLDSAYDIVKDGDDLFAEFLNINQNSGEKPSNYLHRLQIALTKIVKVKAISPHDSDKQLLKQFCRGCWNNSLISTLQLEKQKERPPTFSELLLLLRTEEDRQAAKANRMKQHLGFTKTNAQVQAQSLCELDIEYELAPRTETPPSVVNQLQKQIAELQAQIAALSYPKDKPPNKFQAGKKRPKPSPKEPASAEAQAQPSSTILKKPKPWYCFQCGEDGHIASSCTDPPNPALVNAKKKELRERQRAWEKANPGVEGSLNE